VPMRIGPRRRGDPVRLVADSRRMADELGFAPQHAALDEIVADAWRFYQQARGLAVPPPPHVEEEATP
jgi:UDP-glucose 4-epimerase